MVNGTYCTTIKGTIETCKYAVDCPKSNLIHNRDPRKRNKKYLTILESTPCYILRRYGGIK